MSGLFKLEEFIYYINAIYKKKYIRKISEFHLQMILFFCFAFWSANVEKSRKEGSRIPLSEFLFDDAFEARFNGPVIPKTKSLYHTLAKKPYASEIELFWNNEEFKLWIDELLIHLFEMSEKSLQKLAMETSSFKNHFNNSKASILISKAEIMTEFLKRI